MKHARTVALYLGAFFLATASPAAAQSSQPEGREVEQRVTVHVVNRNFADVRVYAISGGSEWRIGTVTGLTETSLTLPRFLTGTTEPITLVAYAIGGRGAAAATNLLALPGDAIVFHVEPNFGLSYARLLPRS